jgi:Ca-activated chloride channel family protein
MPAPWLAAVLLSSLAWAPSPAADPGAAKPDPHTLQGVAPDVERVRLVLLSAGVTNRKGKPVRGLEARDFRILEDGVPREVQYFGSETDVPLNIAFLLDVSGSMGLGTRLDQARAVIRRMVEAGGPQDEFGLICFADGRAQWVTEFGPDRERFLVRLGVQEAGGRTALYDALAASPGLVDESAPGRKAIILLTDGVDNASRLAGPDALALARSVPVPIYALSFVHVRDSLLSEAAMVAMDALGGLLSETGGALWRVHDPASLETAVAGILQELRFQYVVGYYPGPGHWDGSFRRIDLSTRHRGLSVRTRRGYYAVP